MHTPLHGQNAAIAPEAAGARTAPSMKGKTFFIESVLCVEPAWTNPRRTTVCRGEPGWIPVEGKWNMGSGIHIAFSKTKLFT